MLDLLIDTGRHILQQHAAAFAPLGAEESWSPGLWRAYEEAGLPHMLADTGADSDADDGPTLADALMLVRQAASHAAPVPLAETLLAGYLAGRSGAHAPAGPATLAVASDDAGPWLKRAGDGWTISGSASGVSWASRCVWLVLVATTGEGAHLAVVDMSGVTFVPGINIAGEPCDTVRFSDVAPVAVHASPLAPGEVAALAALFRGAQMLGSLDRLVSLAVDYAGVRQQFGRSLLQFQAVRHLVGRLGAHHAAAKAAFDRALGVAHRDPASIALPVAKIRIGEAGTAGAAIAHQIMGAIGYTREHELQAHSRRIWAWRDDFGSEAEWSATLGRRICAAGGDALWPSLTAGAAREDESIGALRIDVRRFLEERRGGVASTDHGTIGFDARFSRLMGERGWIGANWPREYGGQAAGAMTRFAVLEEMLAHGAPVLAHMVGERQSGPLLLRFGTEAQRRRFLPAIAAGECYFCIGMSEPQAGSDLAALRMKASRVDGGWRVDGSKIWTSLAHLADYIIILCRTSASEERHGGMSQLIVDLRARGVTIAPILNLLGEHEFNQVFFDDVFVPDGDVIGTVGAGWKQALSELTNERGGPDRYLSSLPLLRAAVSALGPEPGERAAIVIGRLVAHLAAVRALGESVAESLALGHDPALEAALVKELGASLEQDIVEQLRHLPEPARDAHAKPLLDEAVLRSPSYSIRGGTREILLGVIAGGIVASI